MVYWFLPFFVLTFRNQQVWWFDGLATQLFILECKRKSYCWVTWLKTNFLVSDLCNIHSHQLMQGRLAPLLFFSPPPPPPLSSSSSFSPPSKMEASAWILWAGTANTWHLTPDTWHLTPDTFYLTYETWLLSANTWHILHLLSDTWHLTWISPLCCTWPSPGYSCPPASSPVDFCFFTCPGILASAV